MGEWWLAGRYRLIEVLGSGGMAVVWRARDTHMHRFVAVKLLRDVFGVPGAADRFAREARTAGTLASPHIVTIHDFGTGILRPADPEDPDSPPTAATSLRTRPDPGEATGAAHGPGSRGVVYVTMELVAGRSLAKVAADEGPLPLPRVLDWARQLCDALEVAHEAGVLHRDIKPANIMASDRGVLKVLDFGIARFMKTLAAGGTLTRPGAVLGTAAYMSPEQANGAEVDPRSDLYSTGCLIYELLTGMPPFGFGDVPSLLFRHVHVEPDSPARVREDLPDAVCELILALLAKNPDDRPQSAAEVRSLLDALPPHPPDRLLSVSAQVEALARSLDELPGLPAEDAVALLRRLLPEYVRIFGHDHPRTLGVRDDLAYHLGKSGDRRTAVRLLRQLVSDYGHMYGAEHPGTLRVRRSLAYWTAKAGNPEAAAVLLRDMLPDYVAVHGPDDPETLKVRRELALCVGRSGNAHEAVRLLRELIPDMTRVLGAQHRQVVTVREELAYWENRMTPSQSTG
ncbi:MAG TPA: serine/threonine-protein kinase [Yinghuangia sp.]|nr:serine/threonine-protein kinase [Yinghuangia sp.]